MGKNRNRTRGNRRHQHSQSTQNQPTTSAQPKPNGNLSHTDGANQEPLKIRRRRLWEFQTDLAAKGDAWWRFAVKYVLSLFIRRPESNRPATSLKKIFQQFLLDHPWPSLLLFLLPVVFLVVILPVKVWHEVDPVSLRSFVASSPSWFPKKFAGLAETTSIDISGALCGVLVGILVTLIVERKNDEKEDHHRSFIESLVKLRPIESYQEVLTTISQIIKDCTYVTEREGNELKQEEKRLPHLQRDLYFLNPTAVFGHTLKYSLDAVMKVAPENRLDALKDNNPGRFREEQDDLFFLIDQNFKDLANDVGGNSNINLHFATLDWETGRESSKSWFESEYLDGVLNPTAIEAEFYSRGSDWPKSVLQLAEIAAKASAGHKPCYLILDEEKGPSDVSDAGTWLRNFLLATQRETANKVSGWSANQLEVTYHPLRHVPFQIVMSYDINDGNGWCLFFVANKYNLSTTSNVAAFTTADPKFLRIFKDVFEAVVANYPSKKTKT